MITRIIAEKIVPWVKRKEIIFFLGPRQVGKTSLLQYFYQQKIEEGATCSFFTFEDPDVMLLTQNYHSFVSALHLTKKQKHYLFLDEIQLHPNPSNFLKFLYDTYGENLKIFVTGSAQLEIKSSLQDSLVGRKMDFYISPFCFLEFLQAKKIEFSQNPITAQTQKQELLEEYMLYGGLPEVVLTEDKEIKVQLLKSYVADYIQKDIRSLVAEKNITLFNQLNIYLSKIIGNLKNNASISRDLSISHDHLSRYLDIFEHTFVYFFLPPFITNEISRVRKNKKLYMFDLGIRNALLSNFISMEKREDSGALFENFFFLELQHQFPLENIFYLRSQTDNEVDFVCKKNTGEVYMYEVKYKRYSKENSTISRGTKSLMDTLSYKQFYIINKGYSKKINEKSSFKSLFDFLQV